MTRGFLIPPTSRAHPVTKQTRNLPYHPQPSLCFARWRKLWTGSSCPGLLLQGFVLSRIIHIDTSCQVGSFRDLRRSDETSSSNKVVSPGSSVNMDCDVCGSRQSTDLGYGCIRLRMGILQHSGKSCHPFPLPTTYRRPFHAEGRTSFHDKLVVQWCCNRSVDC